MADKRYLKRRGERWYYQRSVPKALQEAAGEAVIIRALGTSDLKEAQRKRIYVDAETQLMFDRLRQGSSLASTEIEVEARKTFRSTIDTTNPGFAGPIEADPATGQPWADPELVGLTEALSEVRDAVLREDVSLVMKEVEGIAKRTGAALFEGSPAILTKAGREMADALVRARGEALLALIAAKKGETYEPPLAFNLKAVDVATGRLRVAVPTPKPRSTRHGRSISKVAALYVADRMRDDVAAWTGQTEKQHRGTFRRFAEYLHDCSFADVTRGDVAKFLEALSQLNKHYGRLAATDDMTIWEVLEKFDKPPHLSNRTLNRHARALHGLFKWARRREWFEGENPAAEQTRPEGRVDRRKWLPWTVEELNTWFTSDLYADTSYEQRVKPNQHGVMQAFMWVPLIALFTGMRQDEICSLRAADVKKVDGVWHFDISEDGDGRQLKTAAAIRTVPVHSQLVRCGLLEYVSAASGDPSGNLFPGLKPGGPDQKMNWYFQRRFNDRRRRLGITRPRVAFHSLRANVATALEAAQTPQHEAAQIIGHEVSGMTYGLYSVGLGLKALKKIVEKIEYKGLDLSHLYKGTPR